MTNKKKFLASCFLLLSLAASAQTSQTASDYIARRIQLQLLNPPQPVPNASVSVAGNPGPATYYYWIVTQTSVGGSSPAGPFAAINAPNTLSVLNFNQISWNTAPGGTTYDVLRTSNTGPPSGACICAVATGVSGNTANDQSNSLGAYTVNTFDPSSLTVVLQNLGGTLGVPSINGEVVVNAGDNLQTKITGAGSNSRIKVAPGSTFTLSSKLTISGVVNVTVEGYGSTIICAMADDCIQLGATTSDNKLKLKGFVIKPGNTGVLAAIHDQGFDSAITDVTFLSNGANRFQWMIENDNDQALRLEGIHTDHANPVVRCDATFCGSAMFGPGPNTPNAGIWYVSNSDFSMACSGNGFDNNNGNDVRISNTVIQAFNQFGVRASAVNGSNDVNNSFDQVHIETGNCTNPLFGIQSTAAYILQGIYASVRKGLNGNVMPKFTVSGVTGATVYHYWIVAVDGGGNKSMPLAAGYVTNGSATIDGTHTISVVWNKISSASTYDILRQTFTTPPRTAPFGTGNFAVTTGYTQATCSTNTCTFTDNVTAPSSYSVLTNQGYGPILSMWPGTFVLSSSAVNPFTAAAVTLEGNYNGLPIVCIDTGGFSPVRKAISYKGTNRGEFSGDNQPYSPCTDSPGDAYFGDNIAQLPMGHLIPSEMPFGIAATSKGILNFGGTFQGAAAGEIVTFYDDNPAKTIAHSLHRPAPDAGDGAICKDSTSGATMCDMAKTSWSSYINHVPTNGDTGWIEQRTSTKKSFKVQTALVEIVAPTAASGEEDCYGDSTAHEQRCAYNGGSYFRQTQTIASGTATMTTAAITGPNCGTTVTVAATGVATTDTITFADNAAPAAATNGPLVIKAWPTANNVNFAYCVQSGTITPAAATLNWRVPR